VGGGRITTLSSRFLIQIRGSPMERNRTVHQSHLHTVALPHPCSNLCAYIQTRFTETGGWALSHDDITSALATNIEVFTLYSLCETVMYHVRVTLGQYSDVRKYQATTSLNSAGTQVRTTDNCTLCETWRSHDALAWSPIVVVEALRTGTLYTH
jgi:hypothetical protein